MRRKKGFFSISAVAKMFEIHQQTIRLYEKEGLIKPKRSAGNTRLFSEEDVNRLEEIVYLTHQMGINLAGVEMILKLKKQLKKMQNQLNATIEEASEELDRAGDVRRRAVEKSAQQLVRLKQQSIADNNGKGSTQLVTQTPTNSDVQEELVEVDNWEIEYED